MKAIATGFAAFVLFCCCPAWLWAQSSEEMMAQSSERDGNLREALNQYVAALQKTSDGNIDDHRLRESILRVVQRLTPSPAIPEEAKRFSVRGTIAIKEARSQVDFEDAAREFGKATRAAPWWADAYFNQGVALEKAGKYNDAIRSLKLYLLAAPRAKDADRVREQVYALEYRLEKSQKDAATRRDAEEAKAAAEHRRRNEERRAQMRAIESWSGIWKLGNAMRWRVTISGTNINIAYHDSYNFKTQRWGSNHPCPENWQGIISESLELSLTMIMPESCGWTPRPPTMSWPVAGRIDFDKKVIDINNGRSWNFSKGQWDNLTSTRRYELVPD